MYAGSSPTNGGMRSPASRGQTYQIDFTAVASGKRIASSKRRVRWRFGFANQEAIANGETGTACRGEEHDVTLVWSITSGKRVVIADGQEVHYSSSRNGIFDFSWTMRGNHVLKIVAHASPPLSPTPGWRQYDFYVDGLSFFTFPKVFRLGLSSNDPRAYQGGAGAVGAGSAQMAESSRRYTPGSSRSVTSGPGIASIEAPTNQEEEEAYLQAAIRESQKDAAGAASSGASVASGNLLDFGAPPPTAPALPPSTSANPYGQPAYGAPAPPADPYGQQAAYGAYGAQPAPAPYAALPPSTTPYDYSQASAPAANPYGAPAPAADPYGAPPSASNPYGAHAPAANPYGAPVANPYGAQAPAANPYGAPPANPYGAAPPTANPYGAPPAGEANPYGAPVPPGGTSWTAPAPITTDYGTTPGVPPHVTPQAQQTPSTLGFASPPADFSGFSPPPQQQPSTVQEEPPAPAPQAPAPAPVASADPALQSMNTLFGQQNGLLNNGTANASGSLADQAYSKLVSMDNFSLVSKKEPARDNPFGGSTSIGDSGASMVGGNRSLADMRTNKASPGAPKDIMKAPGALVVSSAQNGNNWAGQAYGGYAQPMQQQQQQQPYAGAGYGQPPMQQPQAGFGQPPTYGQQPPMQQQPPTQPQQYGMPYQQQQPPQQQYGQYGQQPQQGYY